VRNWGRIGTNGQELVEVFATEAKAGQAARLSGSVNAADRLSTRLNLSI
jgi:predicted DNA-binding WGR domain protein